MSLFLFLGARCARYDGCESSETEGSREWSLANTFEEGDDDEWLANDGGPHDDTAAMSC